MIYHILNGDALKTQLGDTLDSELIICREMMIDGPSQGLDLSSILVTRQNFFNQELEASQAEYASKSITELEKLLQFKNGDEINLWFEDDLFCQANFWFCVFVIAQLKTAIKLFLVRPEGSLEFGFGGLNQRELLHAFENKINIESGVVDLIVEIWKAYQVDDFDALTQLSTRAKTKMPWISKAIEAHLSRFISEGSFGLHEQLMLQSLKESNHQDFKSIFKLFSSKAAIYGYGDFQAKKIYDKMIKHI